MRHSLHSGAQPALGIGSLDLDPNHDFDSIWTMDYNASTYQSPAEWDQMILYRPPAGTSCPFEKAMSPEILLNIVEFLEAPQCLTLSQTCKRIYILSRERRGYWTKCAFTHGLLLPGPREQYTTEELRTLAIRQANLEYDWDFHTPRIRRQTIIMHEWAAQEYFIPSGSRWLVQYGFSNDGSILRIWDIMKNRKVGDVVALHATDEATCIAGDSLAPDQIVLACSYTRQHQVTVLAFEFTEDAEAATPSYTLERREIIFDEEVRKCTIKGDVLATTTRRSTAVQQWRNDDTRRWIQRPNSVQSLCQIVEDYLIFTAAYSTSATVVHAICVYDLSPILAGEISRPKTQVAYAGDVDEADNEELTDDEDMTDGDEELTEDEDMTEAFVSFEETTPGVVCSVPLDGKPVDGPCFAPYAVEKSADGRTQINFRILQVINTTEGESLFYTDYALLPSSPIRAPNIQVEEDIMIKSRAQSRGDTLIQTSDPHIIDTDRSNRPSYYVPEGAVRWQRFVQGASGTRILWETPQGVFRIHSDWTDAPSCSRPLRAITRPGRVSSILAFDEAMGFAIIEGDSEHDLVLWIR